MRINITRVFSLHFSVNYISGSIIHFLMAENLTMKYRITGVDEFPDIGGYVAVYLEPVIKLKYDKRKNLPMNIQGIGPKGMPIPTEVMNQLCVQLEQMIPPQLRQNFEDPRNFIHVEPIIDFTPRNWKFGDIVEVSITKVKDANDIDPVKLERKDEDVDGEKNGVDEGREENSRQD